MAKATRPWTQDDGTRWNVEVQLAGASSALIVWKNVNRHVDRYVTWQAPESEARSVTAKLGERDVLSRLSDADLTRLFRRSVTVSAGSTPMGDPA